MTSEKETAKESTEVEMVPAAEEVKENKGIEEKQPENDKVEKKEVKESEEEHESQEDDDGKGEEEETKSVVKGSKNETGELLAHRPTRERKMVERFTVHASPKSAISKHLFIDKGKGEQLKDIPNVAFKLSKRKVDESLHLLHTILFGKKAKVHMVKKNIGHFSGFVWIDSEGKQRGKLKEKIDKCVKEKLLDFCDILNIPVSKATVKKEELSAKLLEFLECPSATTDVLLADKETGKKRKSNDPSRKSKSKSKSTGTSNLAGGKHAKKPKLDTESEKKSKHSTEGVDDDKSESSQSEDDQDDDNKVSGTESESDEKGSDSEKETDEDLPKEEIVVKTSSSKKSTKKDTGGSTEKSKLVDKIIPAKASNPSGKSTKDSASSASKKGVGESESKSKKKALSTKKQETEKDSKMDTSPPVSKKGVGESESKSKKKALSTKKQETEKDSKMDTSPPAKVKGSSKSSTKVLKTDQEEGKSNKKAKKEPTVEEMQAVVEKILKEVDFNTATLSDILRKLGEHFGQDLVHRKSEVRDIITEVIKSMSDDEETSESEDESGKDEDEDA